MVGLSGRPGRPAYVAVIGPCDPAEPGKPGDIIEGDLDAAQEVGRLMAKYGAVLVCGGLGGVMEAACTAARGHEPAGITVGAVQPSQRPRPSLTA